MSKLDDILENGTYKEKQEIKMMFIEIVIEAIENNPLDPLGALTTKIGAL